LHNANLMQLAEHRIASADFEALRI
jgi:hypothetical protein